MSAKLQIYLAILMFAGVCAFPMQAEGGACCMSATVSGVGRLRSWEKFAMGMRTTFIGDLGYWDTQSNWQSNSPNYKSYEWRSEIWALAGLGKKLSMFLRVPWSINYRQAGDLTGWGGFVSDLQVGGRYELLSFGQIKGAPVLAVLFSVTAPTGRNTLHTQHPLAADVTGRGAWTLATGLSLEKVFYPMFLRFDVGVQVPLPMYREDLDLHQRFGVGVQGVLIAGVEVHSKLVLSASLRFLWEDNLRQDEQVQPNSSRIDAGVGLTISWNVHAHWTIVGSFDTGLFASHLGLNQPGRLSGTLGLRYAYF